jgi:fermentation-respiration switch protein FrsA (DUF1100 family)
MLFTRQKSLKTKLKKILLFLLGFYIMIASALYILQEKLIFLPTVLEQDYVFQFTQPFEEVFLKTDTEATIHAIHFKAKNPKGVILYYHGNAGDLSRWGLVAEYFINLEYDVFIMDYRSYGKSKGPLSESAFYHDAQYCYNYLKERYKESEITVYGRSLGTGLASYITSKNNPKQLILETPYFSLVDVAENRFPMFPVRKLMSYKFPSNQFIKNTNCPILIVHGTDDKVVPLDSGLKLFNSAPKERAQMVTVTNANHNNLIEFEAYRTAIRKQLR